MRGTNARNKDDIYASCTRWSGFSKTDGATMLSSPNAACRCARTPLPTLVCVGKRQLRPEAHLVKTCLSTCVATRLRFWPTVSRCNPLIVPGRNRAASVHPIGMTHLAGVFISLEWASQRDNRQSTYQRRHEPQIELCMSPTRAYKAHNVLCGLSRPTRRSLAGTPRWH